MSRPAPARRAGARAAGVRPLPARRVSGPTPRADARVSTAGAIAAAPLVGAPRAPHGPAVPAPSRRGAPLARVRALPDHPLVDRLLRSRAWICLVGLALGGIVAMQVSLLKLNAGISHAVERSAALEQANADLEADIARLGAGERIRGAAASAAMVLPPAGAVDYLTVRPDRDASLAARTMRPPSPGAESVMANGGRAPAGYVPADAGSAAATAPGPAAAAPAATPVPTPAAGIAAAPGTTEAPGTVVPTPPAPAP